MTRLPKLRRDPKGASRASDDGTAGRPLPRRATLRPEIRAALALEEAGELQEAARVFEYAGEHAQAALLRLEHAKTLGELSARVAALREGCARHRGSSPQGRALFVALADGLMQLSEQSPDPGRRRAYELEAAGALTEADEGGRAGEIYEAAGLLSRAAAAYEAAGEVNRLELVLEVLERRERAEAAMLALDDEIDRAVLDGQRRHALDLLRPPARGPLRPAAAQRRRSIEDALPRPGRIELGWGRGRVTRIVGGPKFVIGRAPDADLSVHSARVSRHHVAIELREDGQSPGLVLTDLGSHAGTFWDGDGLEPGAGLNTTGGGELGLGLDAAVRIEPVRTGSGAIVGALIAHPGRAAWWLFLPAGGPLWLDPEIHVPATVSFDDRFATLIVPPGVGVALDERPLGSGLQIELMVGDRVSLLDAPLAMEVLA